jgi:ech hydrogenase subunit A
MSLILLLLIVPLLGALLMLVIKNNTMRNGTIILFTVAICVFALMLAVENFDSPGTYYLVESSAVNIGLFAVEILVTLYIIFISLKNKKFLIAALALLQTGALSWYELSGSHLVHELNHHFYIDKLTIIMVMIIAFVGGLICIYSMSYMKHYHEHHKEIKDRRNVFFAVIFVFFSAMFGIVLANDLVWIFLFWEITTLCSFLLIGYTREPIAQKNAFTALLYNTIGSVFFAAGIIFYGVVLHVTELKEILLAGNSPLVIAPALLIAIAGLTKSAQMPFSGWLLGAMVAPTPTSALLHSSTMVKAGVYIILRMSPLLAGNLAGYFVVLIGGVTFLAASIIAISQNDAKKVLAYSTIANLGLIVSCAGIGTYESLWAAIFLIIFHAVSKSLMFLSVGSVEGLTSSRDIEDMHGLIVKLPVMAIMLTVGIAGMFLAPFGMLISKWAAMKAFLDSKNMIMLFMLVFGSAATLFYWTKWLGKLVAIRHQSERLDVKAPKPEMVALVALAVFTVANCLLFPVVSQYLVEPFLTQIFGHAQVVISAGNQQIMLMLLAMILILPLGLRFLTRGGKLTTVYMGGINSGDNRHFAGAGGEMKRMYLANWYMERYFGENKLLKIGTLIGAVLILFALIALIYMTGSIR